MENKHLFDFEEFTLDLEEKTLHYKGKPISIQPKVFAILEVLVKNSGRIVEKDELMREVWADSFVEESNLTYSIRQLRKVLGDDFRQPKFIETIPRRGYRFIAKAQLVTEGNEKISEPAIENNLAVEPQNVRENSAIHSKKYLIFAISCLLLAVVSGLFYFFYVGNSANEKQSKILAVLPFTNLKPSEETNYLGYAFADTLNAKLTSMRTFKIFPSSLMTKFSNPQDFLSEYKAEYVVTGTYLKEGNKLNISSQVFDVSKNETLFQDSFELNDEQLSQTSEIIARRLINELRLRPQEISKFADMSEINPQAYNFFLKGIEQYSRFRLAESIENLEKAVAVEPKFAAAWSRLGNSYLVNASTKYGGTEYYEKAEKSFLKSIELDSANTYPQTHLADMLIETNRKERAIEILQLVLKKEPENALAWWELSYAYRYAGKLEKAIETGEKAHQVDPGFFLNTSVPTYYLYAGDFVKFKNAVSRRTDSAYIKFYQGFAEYHLDNKEAAKQLFDEAFQLDSNSMQTQIGKSLSYFISGEAQKARELLLKVEKEIIDKKVSDGEGIYKAAQVFAVLDDKPKALQLFNLAVEKGFFCYPYFQNDLLLKNLRNEKQFNEILAKAQKLHANFNY